MKRWVGLFHGPGHDSDPRAATCQRIAGRISRSAGLVLVAFLVAACGSSGASSAPTAAGVVAGASGSAPTGAPATPAASVRAGGVPADACSLLTQSEVSAALGESVGSGSSASTHGCEWAGSTSNVILTIQLGSRFTSLCGVPSNSALGIKIVQVSGVGDGACYTEATVLGTTTNLTFEKGGQVYSVAVSLGPQATTAAAEAAEKTLSLDALARL